MQKIYYEICTNSCHAYLLCRAKYLLIVVMHIAIYIYVCVPRTSISQVLGLHLFIVLLFSV